MAMIVQLFRDLTGSWPPMVTRLLGAGIALIALATWRHVIRERQIRNLLRQAALASGGEREAAIQAAIDLAGDVPRRWGAIAREARLRKLDDVAERATEKLRALGAKSELEVLARLEAAAPTPAAHPLEVAAAVERLIETGALGAARTRLSAGLARHPDHPALRDLAERLAGGAPRE